MTCKEHRGPNELEERKFMFDSDEGKRRVILMKNKFGNDCRLCPMPTDLCSKRRASFDAELFQEAISKL